LKTHYELLGLVQGASGDDVKRAFRREIARYHPDKVQHLGAEFQEIAATRAAELTEAYRILMDPEDRAAYDAALAAGTVRSPLAATPAAPSASARPQPAQEPTADSPPPPVPESLRQTQATMSGFVRKATMARVREAVETVTGGSDAAAPAGFDAAFVMKPRRGLFQKSEAPVHVLVRIADCVDGAAIGEVWPVALRMGKPDVIVCVLLLGASLSSAGDLAAAIAEQRRKSRQAAVPLLVPVDTRDWDALIPPETPATVRKLLDRLKLGG
jgi:DnaJ-like protein